MGKMNNGDNFVSPLDLAQKLRTKIEDPVYVLTSAPYLEQPVVVSRSQVASIERLSRILYHLSFDGGILISLAFNLEDIDSFINFKRLVIRKRHSNIYYCIDVHV